MDSSGDLNDIVNVTSIPMRCISATRSDRARLEITVYSGQTIRVPAMYHIRKQGKKFGNFVYCL